MTAETLHDALTLLPADLIAAADKKRNRKPIRIHWQRWAAMAACLAVILGCGLLFRYKLLPGGKSAEAPAQYALTGDAAEEAAAAEMPANSGGAAFGTAREESPLQDNAPAVMGAAAADGIRYAKTPNNENTTACYAPGPEITLVTSRAQLDAYRDEWEIFYLLDDFTAVCEDYTDSWFENHDLVLIAVDAVPVDSRVTVTQITRQEQSWEVHLTVTQPDEDTECTTWHILLETEKGQLTSVDAVTVIFE